MNILTTSAESYTRTFASFVNQFIEWGEILFAGLLVINLVWLCFWYAFDKNSIPSTLSAFLKKAFIIMLFYTFMLHPSWLVSILKTSAYMGNKLTGLPIDPSSIISNGIAVANKVIAPVARSSLLTMGLGAFVALGAYCIILFCFVVVALELAVTLITSSALVAVAPLFLGFSALDTTSAIARQTLDVILANAVKLLGIYLTIGAGAKTIEYVSSNIPEELISFDPYCWIVATALLFWQVSKHLPNQLARIVSGAIHDHHGSEMAASAMMISRTAPTAMNTLKMTASGLRGAATMAGSIANNAAVRMTTTTSSNLGASTLKAAGGVMSDVTKSSMGTVSDHFKNIMNKSAGGPGAATFAASGSEKVAGFSERMYQATQDFKARSENSAYSSGKDTGSSDKPFSKPTQPPIQ